jgi:heme O synthase-like polyprenyltransferase
MFTHWTPLKFIMAVLVVACLAIALFAGEGGGIMLVPAVLFGVLFLALSVNKVVDDRKK